MRASLKIMGLLLMAGWVRGTAAVGLNKPVLVLMAAVLFGSVAMWSLFNAVRGGNRGKHSPRAAQSRLSRKPS